MRRVAPRKSPPPTGGSQPYTWELTLRPDTEDDPHPGLRGYAAVARLPGAAGLLVFGFIGRLGISMEPLGLILLVRQATGGYAGAALAGASYTLAYAAAQPIAGRLVDRFGTSAMLLATAAVHPLGIGTLIVSARSTGASLGVIAAAAALSGATYPPLIAVLRSAWTGLTEPHGGRGALRRTALAADTALYQSVFVIGPLVVAALVAVGSASLVPAVSAVVVSLGTIGLAGGQAVPPRLVVAVNDQDRGLSPLRAPGFPALLVCSAGLGLTFGVITVAVPAFVTGHDESSALVGLLLSVLGIGSVLGGIGFGAIRPRAGLPRQFAVLLVGVAVSFAIYAAMPHPPAMAVALFCGGALVAPALTVETALVGAIVPAGTRTRAFTWMVGVEATGTAVGLQLAGVIADGSGGAASTFLCGSLAVLPAVVFAALPSGPARDVRTHDVRPDAQEDP